jgi:hypothetical protein
MKLIETSVDAEVEKQASEGKSATERKLKPLE